MRGRRHAAQLMRALGTPLQALPAACGLLLVCLLGGCAGGGSSSSGGGTGSSADGPPLEQRDVSAIADATPRAEPRARYGNMESYVVFGQRYYTKKRSSGFVERGEASWYGKKFHGRKTSSGEVYDMWQMTAAHKTLPLPTYVRVTRLDDGRSVVVKVNDRGPFHGGRIIDLSYAAAVKLGIVKSGTARVEVQALEPESTSASLAPPGTRVPPGGKSQARDEPPREVKVARGAPVDGSLTDGQGVGAYFIQLGAFSSGDNAQASRQRLADAGVAQVFVLAAGIDGSALHRVRSGPYATRSQAQRRARQLASAGVAPGALVVE